MYPLTIRRSQQPDVCPHRPQLQNIDQEEEGRRIRKLYRRPGNKIVAADYSQIELRIMAHLSQDTGLLTAFAEGLDVHSATAEVFGVGIDAVSGDQRRKAKAINFGLITVCPPLVGQAAGYWSKRSAGVHRSLLRALSGGGRYMARTRESAHNVGYVETLRGRRLYLPEITRVIASDNRQLSALRLMRPCKAAADIIKMAMLAVDDWLDESKINARLIMQVHDELVFEVEAGAVDDLRTTVCQLMSDVGVLDVPLWSRRAPAKTGIRRIEPVSDPRCGPAHRRKPRNR